jgi:hypothetical protein
MLDRDLAELYEVPVKRLNEQVKRNKKRFPDDFMFKLTLQEQSELVAKCDRFKLLKHSSSTASAFTENGVAMLSSVLTSSRAIEVNIQVMRVFTRLRKLMTSHKNILKKLKTHEVKLIELDKKLLNVFDLLNPPVISKKKRIGFLPPES